VHRATKVNEASALQSLGQVDIDFNPEYQVLKLHALRILRGTEVIDRLADSKVRFLERELGLENSIYTGVVTALIVLEDLRVGDTLEFSYSTEGRNPVMGDRITERASWEQLVPVQHRRVSLLMPAKREVHYRFIGGADEANQVEPRVNTVGNMREMIFEQFDIKPVRPEGAYTPWYQPLAWLQFSEYDSWSQVAQWGAGLFEAPQPDSAEFKRIVADLEKLKEPAQQVMSALNFVQSEIRYTSISLGENSHRPTLPDEVLRHRYGDCKDKALLMVALLRAVGIHAKPVLASLQYRRELDQWLPSPDVFDHAIVNVELDGVDYWLDATAYQQADNIETLGQLHGLSEVLVADAEVSKLSHIELPPPEQNENDLRQVVRLADFKGGAELESVYATRGLLAEYFRQLFAMVPRETVHKVFLDEMRQIYPDAEWIGDIVVEDNRDENRLVIRSRFKLPKFAEKSGSGWMLLYRPSNIRSFFALPRSTRRQAPYALAYPLKATFHFEAYLPKDVSVLSNDSTRTVRNSYFLMKQTRREKGNVAEADYELATFKPEVPAGDMESFTADLRKVREEFRTLFFIADDEIHKGAYAQMSPEEAFAAAQKERLKQKVDAISKMIDGGKLSGSDLAYAYSERASARSFLGDETGARSDIKHALKLGPDQKSPLTVSGELYFHDANFEKSLESYTKVLSIGGDPADIYYRRGINYVMLGRYPEALKELQKAVDVDTDEERVPYHLLWYAIASTRSGQTIPSPMQERMNQSASGHWPRPLLGMFGGSLSPDEVLTSLKAKSREEQLLNSCEAHFFIGEYHLANGDMDSAKRSFEQSIGTNAILYIEYEASQHELKRLGLIGDPATKALDQSR